MLPNMDDIAFFESKPYKHRGGIWGDAIRKERTVSEMLDDLEEQKPAVSLDNGIPVKSESIDVLPSTLTNAATAISVDPSSPEQDAGVRRATTVAALEMNEATKQKSWFGSTRSTDTSSLGVSVLEDVQEGSSSEDRGRGLTVETSGRRATSVPASKSASGSTSAEEDNEATPAAEAHQDSLSSTFSSRIRSLSSGAGMGVPSEPSDTLSQGTSRDSISGNSRGSGSNVSTNASSFLSALKSKTDKQALNNAAKEAMRKWSANWNGFKRGRMAGGESGGQEDHVDGAPSSATSSLFSFPRSEGRGYSDIRAAVASRRDRRDRESTSEERPEGVSRPIDIPARRDNGEGTVDDFDHSESSVSASKKGKESGTTPSTPPQTGSPRGPTLLRGDLNRSAPSPPRVTTESHVPDNAHLSSLTNGQHQQRPAPAFVPPPSPPPQAPPIKTQPSQGAMMTIPGIHASHRGDVMSMGYVAPTPATPPPTEHKLRTPAIPPTIQNMYRLFKSPTSGASVLQRQQQQPTTNSSAEGTIEGQNSPRGPFSEHTNPSSDINDDVAPLLLSPAVPNILEDKTSTPAKPAPPPLPPRSTPVISSSSSAPQESGQSLNTLAASALSASYALKLVAEQDEAKRRSLDAGAEAKIATRSKRSSLGAKRISLAEIPQELMSQSIESSVDHQGEASDQPQELKATDGPEDIPPLPDTIQGEPHAAPPDVFSEHNETVPASTSANSDVAETPSNAPPELPKRPPPPLPPRKHSVSARA